jgi:hypothetical protein
LGQSASYLNCGTPAAFAFDCALTSLGSELQIPNQMLSSPTIEIAQIQVFVLIMQASFTEMSQYSSFESESPFITLSV